MQSCQNGEKWRKISHQGEKFSDKPFTGEIDTGEEICFGTPHVKSRYFDCFSAEIRVGGGYRHFGSGKERILRQVPTTSAFFFDVPRYRMRGVQLYKPEYQHRKTLQRPLPSSGNLFG